MSTSPLLLDLPEWIESSRLRLRAPRKGDGAALNTAILESWSSLHQWMPWAREQPSVFESEENVRRMAAAFLARTDLPLFMFLSDGQTFVGATGLHRMNWSVPRFEIGYWIRSSFEGQGYVAEAVTRLTAFALKELGAARIEIHCSQRNVRSQRVAERCGYLREGTLRNHRREPSGELGHTIIFSCVPSEGA